MLPVVKARNISSMKSEDILLVIRSWGAWFTDLAPPEQIPKQADIDDVKPL
jgi:hypothetical protein